MTRKTAAEYVDEQPEPLVLVDPELVKPPDGEEFWTFDEMFPSDKTGMLAPHFSVQEVAKMYFGRSPDWLRLRMRGDDKVVTDKVTKKRTVIHGRYPNGYFLVDGRPMEFKRTDAGARYFTLADVERMAHALGAGGHIDGAQLTNVVVLVKTCAKQWGYLA